MVERAVAGDCARQSGGGHGDSEEQAAGTNENCGDEQTVVTKRS